MNRKRVDRREIDRRCSIRQLPGAASDLCPGSVVLHPVYPCGARALLLRARDEVHDECRPAVGDLPEDGGGARGGQLQHTDAAQSALLHTQRSPRWAVAVVQWLLLLLMLLLAIVVRCLMMMTLLLVMVASC